jgi:hypothetical protein
LFTHDPAELLQRNIGERLDLPKVGNVGVTCNGGCPTTRWKS